MKPARLVAPDEPIEILGPPRRFVGRGGDKLEGALERFGVDPTGRRAIDCGASTGGFTDALLQRGASEVVAIDVGYGQLHERLQADPRVESHERTNIRGLDPDAIGGRADLVVADLSFISLRTVADDLLRMCRPTADVIVLVKPQFEAGRTEASRARGVITDPEIWRRVLGEVHDTFQARGAAIMGAMTSPIQGADGNVEFLVHLIAPGDEPAEAVDRPDAAGLMADAVHQAAHEASVRRGNGG